MNTKQISLPPRASSRLLQRVRSYLSRYNLTRLIASNEATILSLDFPRGLSGSCLQDCSYCYAASGKQVMHRAVFLQWQRYAFYRGDPEGCAVELWSLLKRFRKAFDLPLGKKGYPLRLFGAGDLGDVETFFRFLRALRRRRVEVYGYSRYLEAPAPFFYSCDKETEESLILSAKKKHRPVAFVRFPTDRVPEGVDVIFPSHRHVPRVPRHKLDCPKIRAAHFPGACYRCGRCFN